MVPEAAAQLWPLLGPSPSLALPNQKLSHLSASPLGDGRTLKFENHWEMR